MCQLLGGLVLCKLIADILDMAAVCFSSGMRTTQLVESYSFPVLVAVKFVA